MLAHSWELWPIMKYATNRLFSDPDTRMRKSTWSNDRRLCNILALIRLAMAHALDAYRRKSAKENGKTKIPNMLKWCRRAVPAVPYALQRTLNAKRGYPYPSPHQVKDYSIRQQREKPNYWRAVTRLGCRCSDKIRARPQH